jgi:PGF-pre-PGF domain-containing protein
MVAVLVFAPMTMAVGAVTTSTTQSNNTYNVADDRTYNVTDSITIWDRSPLSFEIAPDDANTTIHSGSTIINLERQEPFPLEVSETRASVYPTGEPVTTVFESDSNIQTSKFNGNDTQVVIARLNSDTPASTSLGMVSSLRSNVTELFTAENANQNATFWVKNGTEIDGGSVQTEVTFSKSGVYALFLATGNSFSAPENGENLSVNGESTIVGMTNAVVESEPASLTGVSESVVPGDNATFTVDPGTNSKTNVSVLLYNSSTVEDSRTEFVVREPVNSTLAPSDLTIRHSIANVSGVAEFDGSTSILGTEFNDQRYSGTTSAVGVLERAFEEANTGQNTPETEVITEDNTGNAYENTLDASAVSKTNISGPTTINVPTFENWSTGEYTYLVVTGSATSDLQTASNEITLSTADEDEGNETEESLDGASGTVNASNGRVNVTLTKTTPGQEVRIRAPVDQNALSRDGHAVSGMRMRFNRNVTGTINSTPTTTPNAPAVSPNDDLGYFEITHRNISNSAVDNVTFEFSVSKQRLNNRSINASEVVLHRYVSGSWTELPTRQINETSNAFEFEADSPGLSLYAISTAQQTSGGGDGSVGGGGGGGGGFVGGSGTPSFNVTSASVTPTSITVGESVDVTATIENGGTSGEFSAELQIDGSTVETKTIEIGENEEETVEFMHTFDEAGDYSVSVSDYDAGTVSVTEQTTTTTPTTSPPPTQTTAAPPGGGSDGTNPLVWVGLLIVIAVLVAGIYLYQTGYFEGGN